MKHQETWEKIAQVLLDYRKRKIRNHDLVQEEKKKKKKINSEILIVIVMTFLSDKKQKYLCSKK